MPKSKLKFWAIAGAGIAVIEAAPRARAITAARPRVLRVVRNWLMENLLLKSCYPPPWCRSVEQA
jgi:hypothetical protein